MEGYRCADEFREVIDRVFGLLRDDPAMGPALRDADAPQRFHFTDLDLVVNIRAGHPAEPNLVANRYFQGKLNVPVALARRRVRIGGDLALALKLVPLTQPLGPRYRELLATEYPHLLV
jgi:hypothetical protein